MTDSSPTKMCLSYDDNYLKLEPTLSSMVEGEQFECRETGQVIYHCLYGSGLREYELGVNVNKLPPTPGGRHTVDSNYSRGIVCNSPCRRYMCRAVQDSEVVCPARLGFDTLDRITKGEASSELVTSLFSEVPRRVDFEECYEFTSTLVDMVVEAHGPDVFENVVELRVCTVEDWNKIRHYGTPNLKYLSIGSIVSYTKLHVVPNMTTLEIGSCSVRSLDGVLDDVFLKRLIVDRNVFDMNRECIMTKCKHLVYVDGRYIMNAAAHSIDTSIYTFSLEDVAFSRVELITYRVVRAKGAPSSQTYNFSFKVFDRSRLFKVLTGGDSPTFRH